MKYLVDSHLHQHTAMSRMPRAEQSLFLNLLGNLSAYINELLCLFKSFLTRLELRLVLNITNVCKRPIFFFEFQAKSLNNELPLI